MNKYEQARQAFKAAGYIATTRQLLATGIHSNCITELVRSERIYRIRRGVYEWADSQGSSDVRIIARLLPDAIFCMDTMLHHYGYSDRTPDVWHIAVNRRSNRKRFNIAFPPLKVHFVAPSVLEIGVTEATIDGVKVRVYDRERTICDVIRHSSKIEPEVVSKAIQAYARDRDHDFDRLMEYARRFRIQRRVQDLIGVWVSA